MKLSMWKIGALALLALLPLGQAFAAKTETIVKAENKENFAVVVLAIQQEMQPGGRYGYIDKKEAAQVNSELAYMQSVLDRYGTVAQMDPKAKIDLFNHQEAVNAILTRRDNKRLICQSVAPVGSHIPRTTCRTYGAIEAERRNTKDELINFRRVQNVRGGN
jgi:hypothetical protein